MRDPATESVRGGTLYLVQSETPQERQIIAAWLTERFEEDAPEGGRLAVAPPDDRLHEPLAAAAALLGPPLRGAGPREAPGGGPPPRGGGAVARGGNRRTRAGAQRLIMRRGS